MQVIRIRSINLDPNKHVWLALTAIYGIGKPLSLKICQDLTIEPNHKLNSLTEEQLSAIRDYIKDWTLEGDLRKETIRNIQNLIHIKSYRGSRHKHNLPVRGQNTRTNAATVKKRKSKLKINK